MSSQTIGKRGEELAAAYLRREGYRVVERNCRLAFAEIDLVALQREILVFVEVKTRLWRGNHENEPTGWLGPEDALASPAKRRRLGKAAQHYANRLSWPSGEPVDFRVDLIAIVFLPGGRAKLRHYRNAFTL